MVHALGEIHRVLKPKGILIDLRPVETNWSAEISSSTGYQVAGGLIPTPVGMADDEASFRAMREVESRGWYFKEKEEEFPFFYYWDTPSEMKQFMDEEWEDFVKVEDEVYQQVKSQWASANADAQVRIRMKLLITRWCKSGIESG